MRAPELKARIFPQLALGLTRDEQLEALQAGKLDFAVLPLVFGVKKVPEFSLALLPGLIPNLATARALKGSAVHAKLQAVAAANGLRIVTWWWMRGGFATAKEVTGPVSVKGMKLQSCGLAQKVLAGAGAKVADDPWGEISMRLEMGALDGVAVPYEDFISMRLADHAKFGTFGGPSILTCFSPMLMSKRTWDRLTPEQQHAVEEAADVADTYFETVADRGGKARAVGVPARRCARPPAHAPRIPGLAATGAAHRLGRLRQGEPGLARSAQHRHPRDPDGARHQGGSDQLAVCQRRQVAARAAYVLQACATPW